MVIMTQLTIDKAGRVIIPKPLRDELFLQPGDSLEVDSGGGQITLRPVKGPSTLYQKEGLWVMGAKGAPMSEESINELLADARAARDAKFGPLK